MPPRTKRAKNPAAAVDAQLARYREMRDFSYTAEPRGAKDAKTAADDLPFVVQKHAATRLHYDFRLGWNGVLKSWAVAKGPSYVVADKRLAVEVEDHPVEYGGFEGTIPKGQYGGGTVMLWDQGKYYVYGEQPLESLRKGRLHIVLDGKKAKGEGALIRIRGRDGEKNQWLILKATASIKPISKKLDDESVKTGRTMKQIAGDQDAEWHSNRTEPSSASKVSALKTRIRNTLKKKDEAQPQKVKREKRTRPAERSSPADVRALIDKLAAPDGRARFIEPMKPRLFDAPPDSGDWVYELKFDGIRALAIKRGSKVSLLSRNQNELGARYPEVVRAIATLPVDECVIDGEVVALDDKGRSSFQLLQALELEGRKSPTYYYVFDLLQAEGKNLTTLPLETRKDLLGQIIEGESDPIRASANIPGKAEALLAEVKKIGLEGIIGKQRGSIYEPGRRSGVWIKLKSLNEQEFVIGGYTPPAGARKYFGAILVGYYEPSASSKGPGVLRFAGKVGTGFNSKTLALLHRQFQPERRLDCPFVDLPSKQDGKWAQGISPAQMRQCTWINP